MPPSSSVTGCSSAVALGEIAGSEFNQRDDIHVRGSCGLFHALHASAPVDQLKQRVPVEDVDSGLLAGLNLESIRRARRQR